MPRSGTLYRWRRRRNGGARGAWALLLALGVFVAAMLSAAPTYAAGRAARRASAPEFSPGFTRTLHVPADYPTIQAAVDASRAGDLILVEKGVYHEAVQVNKDHAGITIRGVDRNATVLDGQSDAQMGNGVYVNADNVVLENMTAHHYSGNGFFWYHVTGYRGSFLTTYDTGDYGIYARGSHMGEFNDSYASGSPDSGFYIGECFPCDALITRITSERNGLGYSGTNAGGNLIIKDSLWQHNQAGIVPNTLESEKLFPQRGTTIINNTVNDNNNDQAPGGVDQRTALGVGIMIPGGDLNYIANNRVTNQQTYGILISGITSSPPDDKSKTDFWAASGNVVEHNHVSGSGIADLALAFPTGANNCFSDNVAATTVPAFLEVTHPCGSPFALVGGGDFTPTLRLLAVNNYASGAAYHPVDWRTLPAPAAQPNMPDALNAPRGDIYTEPFTLASALPNNGLPIYVGSGGPAMLQPLGFTPFTILQVLLASFGDLLLFALYAVWLAIALYEIGTRADYSAGRRLGMLALVVLLPFIGPIVYYFFGRSKLSLGFRLALVIGAPVACLIVTGVLLTIAGQML